MYTLSCTSENTQMQLLYPLTYTPQLLWPHSENCHQGNFFYWANLDTCRHVTTHWQAISHCDSQESLATLQKNDAVVHHVHSTLALLISSACQLQRVLCSRTEHRANKAVSRYPRSLTYFSEGICTFLLLR